MTADLPIWHILALLLIDPGPGTPIERLDVIGVNYLNPGRIIACIIRLHCFQILISVLK